MLPRESFVSFVCQKYYPEPERIKRPSKPEWPIEQFPPANIAVGQGNGTGFHLDPEEK